MLARYSPNAECEHHAAGGGDSGKSEKQLVGVMKRGCSAPLDLERNVEQPDRRLGGHGLLPCCDRGHEVASRRPRILTTGQYADLDARVYQRPHDEHEDNRWRDQEQFSVEFEHAGPGSLVLMDARAGDLVASRAAFPYGSGNAAAAPVITIR